MRARMFAAVAAVGVVFAPFLAAPALADEAAWTRLELAVTNASARTSTTLVLDVNGAAKVQKNGVARDGRATDAELAALRAAWDKAKFSTLPLEIKPRRVAVGSSRVLITASGVAHKTLAAPLGRYADRHGNFHGRVAPLVQALSAIADRLATVAPTPPVAPAERIDERPIANLGWILAKEAGSEKLKADSLHPSQGEVKKPEDLFSQIVEVGGKKLVAPTHLFGGAVNLVPYCNEDGTQDGDGKTFAKGDAEIAKLFRPGEVGYAIKHHRPEHRSLSFSAGAVNKEDLKLQDTHIEIVVGVEDGAVTVNNPQTYESGRFGTPSYPMVFVRPKFPAGLAAADVKALHDNIRTMLVCFNTVTKFPGDYNGGDPLGAWNADQVKLHVEKMIRAVAGDAEAKAWFEKPENMVYCAELAHLSTSAGVLFALNAATWSPVVGQDTWAKFEAQVKAHNAGAADAFTKDNGNPHVKRIKLAVAQDGMKTLAQDKLAFVPMTMADIVDQFVATTLPRNIYGEDLAPVQAAVFSAMRPQLLEATGLSKLPADDPKRVAVEQLLTAIEQVVGKKFTGYADFRAHLEPLLAKAREVKGQGGQGLFTPPSMFHAIAQGRRPAGHVGLEYVGHGVPVSVLGHAAPPPPASPTPGLSNRVPN